MDGLREDGDTNTEEEEQPQVRDSEESRPIVSASSSTINAASVSTSSRNVETGQIMSADGYDAETNPESVAEEDHQNDGDDEHETENEEETYGIHSLLPHLDPVFIGTPTSDQMMNPIGMQQQLNRNAAD